jgi:hypothetical protein
MRYAIRKRMIAKGVFFAETLGSKELSEGKVYGH